MIITKHFITSYRIDGLKEDLKKRKMLQSEFARAVGISSSHMSRIVSGHKRVSEEYMKKIKRIIGVN